MRERREDSTVVVTMNKRGENGPGSNKPVAPISRLLFSPREEPLVEGTIRRVGIQKAAGIQNADDVWVSRRRRWRISGGRRAHSKALQAKTQIGIAEESSKAWLTESFRSARPVETFVLL